jgi:hypothetical protein
MAMHAFMCFSVHMELHATTLPHQRCRNEESAFWTLSALVESILVNSNIWGAAPCGEQQLLGGQVRHH